MEVEDEAASGRLPQRPHQGNRGTARGQAIRAVFSINVISSIHFGNYVLMLVFGVVIIALMVNLIVRINTFLHFTCNEVLGYLNGEWFSLQTCFSLVLLVGQHKIFLKTFISLWWSFFWL